MILKLFIYYYLSFIYICLIFYALTPVALVIFPIILCPNIAVNVHITRFFESILNLCAWVRFVFQVYFGQCLILKVHL